MEVTQTDFRGQLLPILKQIARAKIITFDLEMSGITTRPRYGPGDRSQDIGKPSLQQQYEEMRSAASLYQIVQLGITCVEEEVDKGFYLARPYNFYLNPLSADGIDVKLERNFTFSSSACDFLRKNNFDFGRMFTHGVPYLSQLEQEDLEVEHSLRNDRAANIPDISVPANDAFNLEFVRKARKEIAAWFNNPKPEDDYLNIGHKGNPMEVPLSGFQRRLIYQLVRKEYPTLRTFPQHHQTFMKVEKGDTKREEEFQKKKSQQFKRSLCKQTGLRWIFEALSGGDLSGLDPEILCVEPTEKPDEQLKEMTLELKTVIEALRIKKHIIVGHNLFTDLGFLYNTFVGRLPLNVRHFQAEVHERFPMVLDTKYLATEGIETNAAKNGLRDLVEPFKKIQTPLVLLHEAHTSYGSSLNRDHEAGFDSWMTAELFIKLAAKLYSEHKAKFPKTESESDDSEDYSLDDESGGADLNGRPDSDYSSGEISLMDHLPPDWHAKQLSNRFAALQFATSGDSKGKGKGKEKMAEGEVEQWLPKISHRFWDIYANKLRVNASEGGVCDLEDGEEY
ncbi:Uncharacterized protein LSUE1_G008322 [Lachnellula suecica]|uniref:Uncharacterized protein n=1 Tax=Lachnellula suecica TaxID=602035 RepID=A0A8T9BYN1_9HELO|nr:Uncharacterized protein LSUE1_G008322 [Lachnellula suecica]